MKKILLKVASGIFLMLLSVITNAQQQTIIPCGMDELVKKARESNPDYDKQMAEQEKLRDQWKANYLKRTTATPVIPVVVHVLWNSGTPSQNISDAQVQSQIDALNIDYMRLNPDTVKTPSAFAPLGANPNIQFCLAQRDPLGNATNGIDRHQTSKTSFFNSTTGIDSSVWYTSKGGADAWDTLQYYNIWVANISPIAGFGIWPGGVFAGSRPGIVVTPTFFGTTGTVAAPYNLGRTATHETGHFLDLHHPWGDLGNNPGCTETDFCNDTPPQNGRSTGCPVFPYTAVACSSGSPGALFMQFMDYPVDSCKYMFTVDQCTRMNACLSGARSSLLTSSACTPVNGINEILQANDVIIYPNPAADQFAILSPKATIHSVEIYNSMGQLIQRQTLNQKQERITLDVAYGIYSVKIFTEKNSVSKRLIITDANE